MNILALDTAQNACSVAVMRTHDQSAREFEWRPRGHAEVLASMIERVMGQADMSFNQLDRVAVTVGPGSFTGLRVGIATARGIALAAEIPIIGISSLEAVAANIEQDTKQALPICVMFDARRGEVYVQLFDADVKALSEPCACAPDKVADILPTQETIAIGSGVELVSQALGEAQAQMLVPSEALNVPDAAILAKLAQNKEPQSLSAEPLYLRAPDAKPQKPPLARQTRQQ